MATRAGYSRGAQLLEEWRGDLSQVEACALLRVDTATYNRFEHGIRKPRTQLALEIERITNGKVTVESWFSPPIGVERKPAKGADHAPRSKARAS
jgi:DNA-binding transcriptional regulator YdaS (Cro superfamily)